MKVLRPLPISMLCVALVTLPGCASRREAPAEPAAAAPGGTATAGSAHQGAFTTGEHRNRFAEAGKPTEEIEAKVKRAYESLFHGNLEEQSVMFPAGENEQGALAYILDVAHDDVRSEGMSYGMMVAVQLDRKPDFDALWNWAKTHMLRREASHPARGYYSWQLRADGTAIDEMPAADGEEYFAMALLFAGHLWGNGTGIYDYAREARQLLGDMKNREPVTGTVNGDRQTTGVALFHPERKMVRFTPDTSNFLTNGDHTDPSYHLPAFYELWARWGPEADRAFWAEAAQVSRDFFPKAAHPRTGLTPDYSDFDGAPKAASWDAHTADFRYDAWRTAMNWAVDWAWWGKDRRQVELSDRILAFFEAQGPTYPSTYTLDGKPTNQDASPGLVATNAVAALASSHPRAQQFVEALYQSEPPTGKYRYYDGLLYMMAMLHVSGNFRIIAPAGSGPG